MEGFVALRKNGSFAQGGLSLFRRNRLIMGSDEEKYKPRSIFGASNSFQTLRVFGELHLEVIRLLFPKINLTLEIMRKKNFWKNLRKRLILLH